MQETYRALRSITIYRSLLNTLVDYLLEVCSTMLVEFFCVESWDQDTCTCEKEKSTNLPYRNGKQLSNLEIHTHSTLALSVCQSSLRFKNGSLIYSSLNH